MILILIPLPFIIRDLQFTVFLSLAIVIGLFYVFYLIGIIGGADFKYLSISLSGMFLYLNAPWPLFWFYISLFSMIYLGIRLVIYLGNAKTPKKDLFQYLDLDAATPLFIKLALYVPVFLKRDNHIINVKNNDLFKHEIKVSGDIIPLNIEMIHNFIDINSDDKYYENKIKNGKKYHIGKIKVPKEIVVIGDNELLFMQPMLPLIPVLFILNCIIALFGWMI